MKRIFLFLTLFLLLIPARSFAQLDRCNQCQIEILGATTPAATANNGVSTEQGLGSTIGRMHNFKEAVFTLNATTLSGRTSENLAVWVQHSADGGTSWTDLLRFTNITGLTSIANAKRVAFWSSSLAPGPWSTSLVADVERALEDRALAETTVNMGPIGGLMRVAYNYNSNTASFTFSVNGFFKE